uniref:Putative OmpR transcriptional regulator n=1 Tax=Gloeochaete wittrockiana TaxID=38269 RepID=A0A3G1IVX6_9EUKA|nr:putative OmpR transcriptional regulator [Gloeochaete wittrockiana]ASQ40205.1 putative OmpR transcriptional regulator [Gloeochaete wittrockiana]
MDEKNSINSVNIQDKNFESLYQDNINLYNLRLTSREKIIFKLVIEGFLNKEIALKLKLSVKTVEKYVNRLLKKTGTKSRYELICLVSESFQFNN